MSESEETWPHGMSVRSRDQIQRDESRDRQRHTRGWYLDKVSFVEGKDGKPRPTWDGYAWRSEIIRPDEGDAHCKACGSTNVEYIDQICYECSPSERELGE